MTRTIHFLAAGWETYCGRPTGVIGEDAILPVVGAPRRGAARGRSTVGTTKSGIVVTYVFADVTCGTCLKAGRPCFSDRASVDRMPLNAHVRLYMAKYMGMRAVESDQEQNWIFSHMLTFVHRLLR